jgi:hypothetical protein
MIIIKIDQITLDLEIKIGTIAKIVSPQIMKTVEVATMTILI